MLVELEGGREARRQQRATVVEVQIHGHKSQSTSTGLTRERIGVKGSTRDVVILGAGFSHALSSEMPLTDQLGDRVLREKQFWGYRGVKSPFTSGGFEKWLSTLAEDQPYLSAAENLANRALFVQLSGAIRRVLGGAEHATLGKGGPEWLFKLLSVLHKRRANVLTLNYDGLVEYGVSTHYLWDYAINQGSSAATSSEIFHKHVSSFGSMVPSHRRSAC